jgi:hypothetical protein
MNLVTRLTPCRRLINSAGGDGSQGLATAPVLPTVPCRKALHLVNFFGTCNIVSDVIVKKIWRRRYSFSDGVVAMLQVNIIFISIRGFSLVDRLCGLVVRVPGYRSRGPGFGSRSYQIFWEVVDLVRGPLSIVRIIEELPKWKNRGSSLENRD